MYALVQSECQEYRQQLTSQLETRHQRQIVILQEQLMRQQQQSQQQINEDMFNSYQKSRSQIRSQRSMKQASQTGEIDFDNLDELSSFKQDHTEQDSNLVIERKMAQDSHQNKLVTQIENLQFQNEQLLSTIDQLKQDNLNND